MRRELSQAEVQRLFVGAVDDALPSTDASELEAELTKNPELKSEFQQYARAVALLKGAPREKAPDALASAIMRRTKRRRGVARKIEWNAAHRFPAEVIVPILLAVAVAVFLMFAQ